MYAHIVYVCSFFNYEGSVQDLSCSQDCTLLTETFDTELGICWGNFSSFRVNVPITTGIILDFTFNICPCCSLSFWYFSILSSTPYQPPLCLLGWPAAGCLQTLVLLFSTTFSGVTHQEAGILVHMQHRCSYTDVPVQYPSYLFVPSRVHGQSLYFTSCYYVVVVFGAQSEKMCSLFICGSLMHLWIIKLFQPIDFLMSATSSTSKWYILCRVLVVHDGSTSMGGLLYMNP